MEDEYADQIIVVAHHYADPFETDWILDRRAEYGIIGQPVVVFDGLAQVSGASSCMSATSAYQAQIEARLTDTGAVSPVEIQGQFMAGETELESSATFRLDDPVQLSNPRAYLVLIEDHVPNQSNTYNWVNRAVHEEDIVLTPQASEVTVSHSFGLGAGWQAENLRVVAFLQEEGGDRQVYQAARLQNAASVPDDMDRLAGTVLRGVTPNPYHPRLSSGQAAIRLSLSEAASRSAVSLEVLDLQGRLVRRIEPGPLAPGEHALSWNGRDARGRPVDAGVYFVKMQTGEGARASRLIVFE